MSLCLSLRLSILLCVGVLLTGAVNPEATPFSRPIANRRAVPLPLTEDLAATDLLDAAIRALDPQRVPWMRMQLWQRVQLPNLVYQSQGLYRCGPGHRLRLDLTVRVGSTEGRMQLVCDGATFWKMEQVSSDPRTVFKVELKQLVGAVSNPAKTPQFLDDFFQGQSFAGPLPLLNGLRQMMRFTRRDLVRCRGQRMVRLIGIALRPAAVGQIGLELSLRQCRLYLDEQTLWPYRLEWWGPVKECGDDTLLMQMEFRDPQLQTPVPEQAFTFDPGLEKVEDRTREWAGNAKPISGS